MPVGATPPLPVVGKSRVELTPVDASAPQPLHWINAPGIVFMFRHGRSELTTTTLDEGQVRDLVEKMPKRPAAGSTCPPRSSRRMCWHLLWGLSRE